MCENRVSLLNVHVVAYYKFSHSFKYILEIIFALSIGKSHEALLKNARILFSMVCNP